MISRRLSLNVPPYLCDKGKHQGEVREQLRQPDYSVEASMHLPPENFPFVVIVVE
jgi:hypothetical protein